MNNKLGKNIAYQTAYQILTVITPLITAPYISRVLGAEGVGTYTFTYTNAMYFSLFALLGVANYGSRSIASVQKNKEARSVVFWNIYTLQIVASALMLLCYVLYLCLFVKDNFYASLVQIVIVLSCAFDVNWYFFGVEKFKVTVMRNIIVKVLTVIAVLVFVNSKTGVIGYCIVMGLGTLISNIVILPFLRKEVEFVKPTILGIRKHIKPNLALFIPVLATSIFHIMDKTMLGNMAGLTQLGYYTNSDKVINIPIGIINGLGTVYLPRITALRNSSDEKTIKKVLGESLEVYSIAIMALSFGLAAIAIEFAPWFLGPGFDPCAKLIILFAPVFIVKSFSVYVRMNILIPFNKEKHYTIAVIVGAVTNLIANAFLIPILGAEGAVIGTLIAETTVCFVQLIRMPIKIPIIETCKSVLPYLLFAVIMTVIVRITSQLNTPVAVIIILEIAFGGFTYIVSTLIYWTITKNRLFLALRKTLRHNQDN